MIKKEILKEIIREQAEMPSLPIQVKREQEDTLQQYLPYSHVIIVTGLRRAGKSTLLTDFRHNISKTHAYLNLDDDRLANFDLQDFQSVLEIFVELYGDERTLFFDEIQLIPEWERFIRRLHDHRYKVFLTGSNAKFLSSEFGTRLTGRSLTLELYPFSFKEYLTFKSPELAALKNFTTIEKGKILNFFSQYIQLGGIPECHQYIPVALQDANVVAVCSEANGAERSEPFAEEHTANIRILKYERYTPS